MADNYLGRDALLGGRPVRARETVELPELGGAVLVQEMDGLEAAHFQRRMMEVVDQAAGKIRDADGLARLNAFVIVCGVVDEEGEKVFSRQDEDAIVRWGSSLQERVVQAILELSGISGPGRARLKKASRATLNGASGSS